jgi:hypothetical protein
MSPALTDAREFLFRHGTTLTVIDPIELIRDLTVELEKHEMVPIEIRLRKKPKARPKPRRDHDHSGSSR